MRLKSLSKALLITGLAVVICGFSIQANAVTFSFQEQAGFKVGGTNLTSTDLVTPFNDIKWYQLASAPVSPISGEFNTIAWGVNNNQGGLLGSSPWGSSAYSALRILGQAGTVDTDGGWVTLAKLYHQNSSISSSLFTLKTTVINGLLNITKANSGFSFSNDQQDTVHFTETLNTAGACVNGGPSGIHCPDFFTVNANTFAPLTFSYGGGNYEVDFQIVPIVTAQIDPVDAKGDIRIWTQEHATSEIDVQMAIRSVPEPASLILLGLGLFGLGIIKRRKKND